MVDAADELPAGILFPDDSLGQNGVEYCLQMCGFTQPTKEQDGLMKEWQQ